MREGTLRASRLTPIALIWAACSAATPAPDPADPGQRVETKEARMPTLRPADIDNALAIGGTEIDGKTVESRMTVAVKVNGRGPYRFVVDSGADSSVMGERITRDLSLPPGTRTILNSVTDSQIVDRVLVDELELGPTTVRNLEVPVLRERDLGGDGMLGLDALVEQRLMLDFDKRIITVDDGRTPPPEFTNEIVVTARLRRGQLILTQVTANKAKLNAVIDTGSQITIGNRLLRDKLLGQDRKQFQEIDVTGVTGTTMKLQIAHVQELRIGGIIIRNVPIAFADIPPFEVFGLEDKPALLLGTDLLENFRKVSLDFLDRKVRFQLKQCRSGLVVVRTSMRRATRMSSDTPAECAG